MFKTFTLLLLVLFTTLNGFSLSNPNISSIEDRIVSIIESIETASSFSEKNELNNELISLFYDALLTENSFDYPFSKVEKVGILTSPNNKLRIITWNIPQAGGNQKYFGFIQTNINGDQQIFPLTDNRKQIETPQLQSLSASTWHGALYYYIRNDIIMGQEVFTLFGVDMNNYFSAKRIIETITLTDSGVPQFGLPVFSVRGNRLTRIIFEYSARASMVLKWEEENQMIVFDHLSPMRGDYAENYQFYVPDLSYDGFKLTQTGWEYVADIDIRNPERTIPPPVKPPIENPEPGFLYRPK